MYLVNVSHDPCLNLEIVSFKIIEKLPSLVLLIYLYKVCMLLYIYLYKVCMLPCHCATDWGLHNTAVLTFVEELN